MKLKKCKWIIFFPLHGPSLYRNELISSLKFTQEYICKWNKMIHIFHQMSNAATVYNATESTALANFSKASNKTRPTTEISPVSVQQAKPISLTKNII